MEDITKTQITKLIKDYIAAVTKRRFVDEPWIKEQELINSPFSVRLVPATIWKSSKYERSFVTGFGGLYEKMAYLIGADAWGKAEMQYVRKLDISEPQSQHIQEILSGLERKRASDSVRRRPNWETETSQLRNLSEGKEKVVEVNSDLYLFDREANQQAFIELKAPKPNKDQSKVSKEKMLKVYCGTYDGDVDTDILFALPFNPWGERKAYAHSFPMSYFDMHNSPAVLMGKEFWNYVGRSENTWTELMELVEDIGKETRPIILKYMGED